MLRDWTGGQRETGAEISEESYIGERSYGIADKAAPRSISRGAHCTHCICARTSARWFAEGLDRDRPGLLEWFHVRSSAFQDTTTMLYCLDTIGLGESRHSIRASMSVRKAPRRN